MQFLSTDYWQQAGDGNASGLLQQQYVCEGVCVHFSCVCQGQDGDARAGGYMTEQLLRWFRGLSLKRLARKPEKALRESEAGLRRIILRVDDELAAVGQEAGCEWTPTVEDRETAIAGIFCVGEEFIYFCRGEQRIYFINTGFGRAHIRRLGIMESDELFFQRGTLQPDIGLLFAVGSFWEYVTEQMMKEGLAVWDVVTEEQMRKHLNELGEEARRQGGKDMAAIFVRTT